MSSDSYTVKVVVLGNFSTGKTSLIERMLRGRWRVDQSTTIGCAFHSLRKNSKYGPPIVYQVWDTAGQERYRSLTSMYYRNADVVILCFDLSDLSSYHSVDYWVNEVRANSDRTDRLIYLVGTKSDLEWVVSEDALKKKTKQSGLRLVITSAKHNRGVSDFLETLTNQAEIEWRDEILHQSERRAVPVRLETSVSDKLPNCC